MATIVFNGSTIWNDATTGFGVLQVGVDPAGRRWDFSELPRGLGRVALDMGLEAGRVMVMVQWRMTDGEYGSLLSTLRTAAGGEGVLQVRGESYGRCVLVDYGVQPVRPILEGATMKRVIGGRFVWEGLTGV